MTNIIEFIKMLDMVVPGFAANETLLYSPELKFYSNKVKMDENLDTNIRGLHCLGDSSGWTRGLMMASVWACSWAASWLKRKAAENDLKWPPRALWPCSKEFDFLFQCPGTSADAPGHPFHREFFAKK